MIQEKRATASAVTPINVDVTKVINILYISKESEAKND
jgi:hypothetical protein